MWEQCLYGAACKRGLTAANSCSTFENTIIQTNLCPGLKPPESRPKVECHPSLSWPLTLSTAIMTEHKWLDILPSMLGSKEKMEGNTMVTLHPGHHQTVFRLRIIKSSPAHVVPLGRCWPILLRLWILDTKVRHCVLGHCVVWTHQRPHRCPTRRANMTINVYHWQICLTFILRSSVYSRISNLIISFFLSNQFYCWTVNSVHGTKQVGCWREGQNEGSVKGSASIRRTVKVSDNHVRP